MMLKRLVRYLKKISIRNTYQRLNHMIDAVMEGHFEEDEYDETELSKLEVKWKRFLASVQLSNQRLEEERKNIKELVSDISHQTKTPLANILLYSQLLEEQNLDETSHEIVVQIMKQSKKLDFLIQSLVKTSRLEAGTFQFVPKKQKLSPMLLEAERQVREKVRERNMQIVIQASDVERVDDNEGDLDVSYREIQIMYDRKWTGEALYNILDNAVKYGNEGSTIQILVKAYEMFVCIIISNEGEGIPEEEIPLIFQRFYRGKNASEVQGVGIGLYLARQIVEEQGGYIKAASKYGEETKFYVYLPRVR